MAVKVRAWIWIVAAIVIVGVLGIVVMAGAGFYFVSRHVDTKAISAADARVEFDRIRAQFTDQRALIELDERGRFVRSNKDRETKAGPTVPDHLNVLAFDPGDERIVKVTIPFWLLRFKAHGATVDINGGRVGLEDLKLTVEDLERFGPTLIVDHQGTHGERVLVWSQ